MEILLLVFCLKGTFHFDNEIVMKKDLKQTSKMDQRYIGSFLAKKDKEYNYYHLYDKNGILMYDSPISELKKVSVPNREHLYDSKGEESDLSNDFAEKIKAEINEKTQSET